MDDELIRAGDRLRAVLARATIALVDGDTETLWRMLDVESARAAQAWDAAVGRPVVSEEESAANYRVFARQLCAALPVDHPLCLKLREG